MQIIRNLNNIKDTLPQLVLAIGNFDGVHLGHSTIINQIKNIAKEKGVSSAILTFEPHPKAFFQKNRGKDFRITSLSQKLRIFQEQGIEYVIILPFNQELANIEANDFVLTILVTHLNVKNLVVGYDFVFGKDRKGTFELLKEKSQSLDFQLTEITALKKSDKICSSSFIRKALKEGAITKANNFLGRNFMISGTVSKGRQLANKLGFPTANLITKPHMITPKFGVYKTQTFIPHLGKKYNSITNFGIKPTIQNSHIALFETYIKDFKGDLYGKKIEVDFIDFVRDEQKFSSIEELQKQISRDVKQHLF